MRVSMYVPARTSHKVYFNQCHFFSGSLQLADLLRDGESAGHFFFVLKLWQGETFPLKLRGRDKESLSLPEEVLSKKNSILPVSWSSCRTCALLSLSRQVFFFLPPPCGKNG